MRKLHDLAPQDQGAAIVREEIKRVYKSRKSHERKDKEVSDYNRGLTNGLRMALEKFSDCLDIATLGEIDMKGHKDE